MFIFESHGIYNFRSFLLGSSDSSKECRVDIKEFGGELMPAWKSYLRGLLEKHYDKSGVLYVVDITNSSQIAQIGVHLIETVQSFEKLRKTSTRILIVFSKTDLLDACSRNKVLNEFKNLLRLEHLSNWCKFCSIEATEFSAVTEEGLPRIVLWLRNFGSNSS